MIDITPEMQYLITRDDLGTPVEVYRPGTLTDVIAGLFLMIVGAGWFWLVAFVTNSPLLPPGVALPLPHLFNLPAFLQREPFDTVFSVLGIVFP